MPGDKIDTSKGAPAPDPMIKSTVGAGRLRPTPASRGKEPPRGKTPPPPKAQPSAQPAEGENK